MNVLGKFCGPNHAEINGSRLQLSGFKIPPQLQRISNGMHVQGAGEIVTAPRWHNQHGESEPHQGWQMAMNRAIAAKNYHRIGVTRRVGQAFRPQGMGLALKSSKVRWRGSQSKDGGGTHDDRFPARLPVLV